MMIMAPRYPEIHVQMSSRNPFAWVSAVRQALRHRAVDAVEIERFTAEALADDSPHHMRNVCNSWTAIEAS